MVTHQLDPQKAPFFQPLGNSEELFLPKHVLIDENRIIQVMSNLTKYVLKISLVSMIEYQLSYDKSCQALYVRIFWTAPTDDVFVHQVERVAPYFASEDENDSQDELSKVDSIDRSLLISKKILQNLQGKI